MMYAHFEPQLQYVRYQILRRHPRLGYDKADEAKRMQRCRSRVQRAETERLTGLV